MDRKFSPKIAFSKPLTEEPDRIADFITITPQVAEAGQYLGIPEEYTHPDSPLAENQFPMRSSSCTLAMILSTSGPVANCQ